MKPETITGKIISVEGVAGEFTVGVMPYGPDARRVYVHCSQKDLGHALQLMGRHVTVRARQQLRLEHLESQPCAECATRKAAP